MSKMATMPKDLQKVRDLIKKFPTSKSIKLHIEQCSRLRMKVIQTLDLAKEAEASCRYPVQYNKVFHELWRIVYRVKTFIDDCCYTREHDFVLAAIKVLAHRERFLKYYVELEWCIFLIEHIKDAKGEPVASEKLEGFEWKKKVRLLAEETRSIVEKDFSNFKEVLKKHVLKPGGHQKICATFLRRFKEETDLVIDDVDFEVPPIEKKGECLGMGAFGEVYNIEWKKTEFAIKISSLDFVTLDGEVAILEKCCHPNIVNLILFHKNQDGKQFLMMEKLSMNLREYLKKQSPVPPLEAVDMILQVCEGMEYLGDAPHVSHRDVKPENILVKVVSGQDGPLLELQVADFGVAKVRAAIGNSSNHTPNVGSTRYIAPEMFGSLASSEDRIEEHSLPADVFSFAITCSYILNGCEPYKDVKQSEIRKFVKEGGRPSLPTDCPIELTSLLSKCWHPEPSERPASFVEICEKLRKLKALLLTSDVHKGGPSGSSSPKVNAVSSSSPKDNRKTFQPDVQPLKILVLGNAKAVEVTCMSLCGTSRGFAEDHIFLKESVSFEPPMILYQVAAHSINYTDIMKFVKVRNIRWHQDDLKVAWKEDLHSSKDAILFPKRSQRLHMVWYVCGSKDDLPDALQWKDITKKLYGVPIQMLVTETKLYKDKVLLKERFFDNGQCMEDLIIKVDLEDNEAKNRLWRTCWDVKTKAEIKNVAMIIRYIQKRLGSSGKVIRTGVVASITKEFAVFRSKEFILNFLCSYWNVPEEVLPSMRNPQKATKFVPFCLLDAATILSREREHIDGLVPTEASAKCIGEAQAHIDAYFMNLDFNACDKMTSGDIQAFLEGIFENQDMPKHLMSGLNQNWSFSKFIGRLCGNEYNS